MENIINYILPLKAREYLVKNNITKAFKYINKGEYWNALYSIKRYNALVGHDYHSLFALAYTFIGLKNKSGAYETLKICKDHWGNEYLTKDLEASFLFKLDDKEKAITLLDEIYKEYPEELGTLNNKGFYLGIMERYQESKETLELLLSQEPNHVFGLDNLGYTEFKLGNTDKGLELVNKSLELDWQNAYAHRNKALILLEQDKKKEATEHIKLAIAMNFTKKHGPEIEKLYYKVKYNKLKQSCD